MRVRSSGNNRSKLIVMVEDKKYTKRFNHGRSDGLEIRHIVAGALPTSSYRCSSDALELRNSFEGYIFQPALNRAPLHTKRVEDVPTIFGGRTNQRGLYLQGTDLELGVPGGVETVSFEMRAHKEPNTIMRLKGKGEYLQTSAQRITRILDTSIELKQFNNDMVLVVVQNKIARKIRLYDVGCVQAAMRVLGNIW